MEHIFGLTKDQEVKLSEWQNALPESKAADRAQFEYHFTVTRDEVTILAECHITNKKLNLGKIISDDEKFAKFSQFFSEFSSMTEPQQKAFNALLEVFPDARKVYSFLPSGLGITCTFSINTTNYDHW
jgi:hypothetical protein